MTRTLRTYLTAKRGRTTRLATALGVSIALVSMWASGSRRIPAERCRMLAQITGVSLKVLRPDIFQKPAP